MSNRWRARESIPRQKFDSRGECEEQRCQEGKLEGNLPRFSWRVNWGHSVKKNRIRMNSGCVLKASSLLIIAVLPVRHVQSTPTLQEKGFLGSFFERKVETQQQAHSDKFAKKERITEIQSHNVKPDSIDKYLKAQENLIGKAYYKY